MQTDSLVRQQPQIVLYQFPALAGQDSMSPFCSKVQRGLRLKGLPFQVVSTFFPKQVNRRSKLPMLSIDGEWLEDSTHILRTLDARYGNRGRRLVPCDSTEAAEVHLWEDWADESLYWYEVYARFAEDENWSRFKPHVARAMPPPLRLLGPTMVRRRMRSLLRAQGIAMRAPERVHEEFERHLEALARRLGRGAFLIGDSPTLADLAAASMLLPLCHDTTPDYGKRIAARPRVDAWLRAVNQSTAPAPTDGRYEAAPPTREGVPQ